MKKTLILVIVLLLTLSFGACVSDDNTNANTNTNADIGNNDSNTNDDSSNSENNNQTENNTDIEVQASIGLELTLNSDEASYTVSGIGSCKDTDIIIPSSYKELPITSISQRAFENCRHITSVRISNPISRIDKEAFYDCTLLESIIIPNSITYIGSDAFAHCNNLDEVHINDIKAWCGISFDNWISFSSNPLYYAKNLYLNGKLVTELIIPDGVSKIKPYAFRDCTSITSVKIPNSVESIGDYAFYGCTELTSVTIGNGVTSIYASAFFGCNKLVEIYNLSDLNITAGDSGYGDVVSYALNVYTDTEGQKKTFETEDEYLFYEDGDTCYLLGYKGDKAEITLPESCNGKNYEIYKYAFYYNDKLTKITIPDSVTSIGERAFDYCYSLTNVTIPDSVTSIGDYAFSSCRSLTSVTIPDSVTSIGERAFDYCYSLTNVTIPNSVVSIGCDSFRCCTNLASVTIGNSVTSIDRNAFYDCHKLAEVYNLSNLNITAGSSANGCVGYYALNVYTDTEGQNKTFETEDGFIFYEDGDPCYLLGYTGDKTDITLPENCHGKNYALYRYAFYNCTSLTSITIPDSVTSIGSDAFNGCDSLAEVHISDIEAWCNISFGGTYANPLYYAKNLYLNGELVTELVIPDTVKEIKACVFYNCTSLTSITIPDSVTSIGFYAFSNCISLTSVTIPDNVTSIDDYAFSSCRSLTSVTIPDSVTSIGEWAFYNCTSLATATIGNGVVSIGINAFSGCEKLVEVYNLSDLNITVGSSDNCRIGYYVLNVYTDMERNKKTFETEDEYLFYEDGDTCYLLGYKGDKAEITLPESCNGKNYEIYKYAFYKNDKLTKITIPDSVTSIGERAFYYCYSLTNVTIPDSVTSIGSYAFSDCSNLTSVTIGNGVTSIGSHAFYNCKSLTSVTIGNGVTSIGYCAFYGCDNITDVTIPNSVSEIDKSAFHCIRLISVTFENPDGWYASKSTATSGTNISDIDLSDPATAARYLRNTYYDYYWKKS